MIWWLGLALWAASFALSQTLADKEARKNLTNVVPKTLEELALPSTRQTNAIAEGWGTRKITSPQLLWYGNFRAYVNKTKVSTSMFNSVNVATGHQYYLSLQLGLGRGPMALRKIWYGNRLVWNGYADDVTDISIPDHGVILEDDDGARHFGQRYAPKNYTGAGPLGVLRFYPGTDDQVPDPYLSEYQTLCPGYRDVAYVVIDYYIGTDPSLQGWSFEVQANPNGLGLSEPTTAIVATGTESPDGETLFSNPQFSLKFTLSEQATIGHVRFKGTIGAGGLPWVDGRLYKLAVVQVFSDAAGIPDISGNKYLQKVTGFADWNDSAPVDWIQIYLNGIILPAGTYHVTVRMIGSSMTLATESAVAAGMAEYTGGAWITRDFLPVFELYGWVASEGSVLADVNPMNAAYDLLTTKLGFTSADIDESGMTTAAGKLDTEGQGFALLATNPTRAIDLLQVIEEQIGGNFYMDPVTGVWKVHLIRGDFDPDDLVVLSPDTYIKSIESFSRGVWQDTANTLIVNFTDRDQDYADAAVMPIDHANVQIQGRTVTAPAITFQGVSTRDLAVKLAWRDLRPQSIPLCTARVEVTPDLWNIHVGQPVILDIDDPEFYGVMRIAGISGRRYQNAVILDLVQDTFSGDLPDITPPGTSWVGDTAALVAFTNYVIMEAPYAIRRRQEGPTTGHLFTAAQSTGHGETAYNILASGAGVGFGTITPRGLLYAATACTDTEINVTTDVPQSDFPDLTDEAIGGDLAGLLLIDDEFLAVRSSVSETYGLTFTVYRGLLDTVPAPHDEGSSVWMVSLGHGGTTSGLTPLSTVSVRLDPKTDTASVSGVAEDVTFQDRDLRPYPPTALELNGAPFPASVDISLGLTATFIRRDWRVLDEVAALTTDAETLNPAFPDADDTQYQLRVYDEAVPVFIGDWNDGSASLTATLGDLGGGAITPLTFSVFARHTTDGDTRESLFGLTHTAEVTT